jgi:hypothetical protein
MLGCTGIATGVLTLADTYTPGTALSLADVISWQYNSSTDSFSVPGDSTFSGVSGSLPNGTSSGISASLDFFDAGTIVAREQRASR